MRAGIVGLAAVLALAAAGCGGGQEASADAALYQRNCQSCHGGGSGGAVQDIPPRHNANGHTWHHADQQLRQIILEGLSIPGRPVMPSFGSDLTADEVDAILAYVKTWWTSDQRAFQAARTAEWGGS